MFQTPFDLFCGRGPAWVEQLLSRESLRATGYFDAAAVWRWRRAAAGMPAWHPRRFVVELGVAAVAATQLWHHTFIDRLADLRQKAGSRSPELVRGISCHT